MTRDGGFGVNKVDKRRDGGANDRNRSKTTANRRQGGRRFIRDRNQEQEGLYGGRGPEGSWQARCLS